MLCLNPMGECTSNYHIWAMYISVCINFLGNWSKMVEDFYQDWENWELVLKNKIRKFKFTRGSVNFCCTWTVLLTSVVSGK